MVHRHDGSWGMDTWATKDYPIATSIRKNSLASSFATESGTGTITVSDTAHDLRLSDKLYSRCSTVGGITAEVLNNEHTIASIPNLRFVYSHIRRPGYLYCIGWWWKPSYRKLSKCYIQS